jgi:hypothetical protein
VFHNDTQVSGKGKMRGVKGLAIAATMAMMAFGSQAMASTNIILHSASMDTSHWANITWTDASGTHNENAYSNGVTFSVSDAATPLVNYDLFGFCIDIYHNMYLGALNAPTGYAYVSNKGDPGAPLTTNFDPGHTIIPGPALARISALVDIGFLMNRDHVSSTGLTASIGTQLAAIQAAIWEVENPGSVQLVTNNISDAADYTAAYNYFRTANLGPSDRFYTISDGVHQTFAIGWPLEGVPEPTTWALLLTGFFGMGVVLRSQRRMQAIAA